MTGLSQAERPADKDTPLVSPEIPHFIFYL